MGSNTVQVVVFLEQIGHGLPLGGRYVSLIVFGGDYKYRRKRPKRQRATTGWHASCWHLAEESAMGRYRGYSVDDQFDV